MQRHAIVALKINGVLQSKATSNEISGTTGAVPAISMMGGLEGSTHFAGTTTAQIRSLVPSAAPEFEFANACTNHEYLTFEGLRDDGKRATWEGYITNWSIASSVGEVTSYNAEITGVPTTWT